MRHGSSPFPTPRAGSRRESRRQRRPSEGIPIFFVDRRGNPAGGVGGGQGEEGGKTTSKAHWGRWRWPRGGGRGKQPRPAAADDFKNKLLCWPEEGILDGKGKKKKQFLRGKLMGSLTSLSTSLFQGWFQENFHFSLNRSLAKKAKCYFQEVGQLLVVTAGV